MLLFVTIINTNSIYAGWENDTVGDASATYFDITKLSISKTSLTITLNENPYFNDSGANIWRHYNILIDTSMHDTYPDTTNWSEEVFEYRAHFDCRWNGDQWLNTSYILAYRYYLTSDGSDKVEGTFYWDGNSWEDVIPDLDIAVVSDYNITFDINGAIYREQPLGTGYVVQGVARASTLSTLEDIAPNSGWVDEFDNECELPDDNTDTTGLPISTIGVLSGIFVLGFIVSKAKFKSKRK